MTYRFISNFSTHCTVVHMKLMLMIDTFFIVNFWIWNLISILRKISTGKISQLHVYRFCNSKKGQSTVDHQRDMTRVNSWLLHKHVADESTRTKTSSLAEFRMEMVKEFVWWEHTKLYNVGVNQISRSYLKEKILDGVYYLQKEVINSIQAGNDLFPACMDNRCRCVFPSWMSSHFPNGEIQCQFMLVNKNKIYAS